MYCWTCDRPFDPKEQDHADYERDMCQDCVDLEKEKKASKMVNWFAPFMRSSRGKV